jgi:phosphoribosyl 1,2-cyclic phosphodiesterase
MKLNIVGTGSSGNCYVLEHNNRFLIIDCGVNWDHIKKAVDFRFSNIDGLLISHQHGDHSKSIDKAIGRALKIYTSNLCAGGLGISSYANLYTLENFKISQIGDFQVMPLPLDHDAPCQGFVINHYSVGTIVFATDTTDFPYVIPNVNHWIIEANFCEEILKEKIEQGNDNYLNSRVINSHMSIQKTIKALQRNNLNNTKIITLIHLSDRNSDEARFLKITEQKIGIPTFVASNGMELNLSNDL